LSEHPCLSLRVARRRPFGLDELVDAGGIHPDLVPVLLRLVSSRAAFLVSGGTGTGKTTVLATLLGEVNHRERVLVVEDTAELAPTHPHVVRLTARTANGEGQGSVSLRDLVRQALRMRPDRLVVGEVRGPEVIDLMTALNTGHEGGCGTLHANRAADVPARVEALAALGGMGREAAHSQLAAAVSVVVHLSRGAQGRRQVTEVASVVRDHAGFVNTRPAWRVDGDALLVADGADDLDDVLCGGSR
jgi:pilus assembly protein CpaF